MGADGHIKFYRRGEVEPLLRKYFSLLGLGGKSLMELMGESQFNQLLDQLTLTEYTLFPILVRYVEYGAKHELDWSPSNWMVEVSPHDALQQLEEDLAHCELKDIEVWT